MHKLYLDTGVLKDFEALKTKLLIAPVLAVFDSAIKSMVLCAASKFSDDAVILVQLHTLDRLC